MQRKIHYFGGRRTGRLAALAMLADLRTYQDTPPPVPKGRHIKLEAPTETGLRRFVVGGITLGEGNGKSWVTLTRTGRFNDPRYGDFEITRPLLQEMVSNFQAGTYGQKIFIDVAHKPQNGAAGEILEVKIEGDRLRALIEWTDYGREAVQKRGFRYMSAEYHEHWKDNEAGKNHGCVLLGAGLVTRPCIKWLDPVTLSEAEGEDGEYIPTALHPTLLAELIREVRTMKWSELVKKLTEKLKARGLGEKDVAQLVATAEKALANIEDEAVAKELCDSIAGIKLSEGGAPAPVSLNVTGVSAADVHRILSEHAAAQATEAKKLAETLDAKRKLFSDHLAEVGKGLPEDARKALSDSAQSIISAAMDDTAVKALAETFAKNAEQVEAARQLSGMGYGVRGRANIEVPAAGAKKLGELVRDAFKRTDAHASGALRVPEKDGHFVAKVLAEFDHRHAHQLEREHRALADGNASTGDYFFPAGLQREVIREALSDLNVLQLVRTNIDPTAQATTEIPFEVRPDYQPVDDGQVFEGQPIPRYQTTTDHETALITPMKLGMQYTNELAHFTSRSQVNWDAVAENIAANARTIREMVARRIANELQRASDSYGAVAVNAEDIKAQITAGESLIKLAHFPVVRPYLPRNLKGVAQGNAQHPITISLNGTAIAQWDGTGKQAAGTYWTPVNFNLGFIQFVNKDGEPVVPSDTGACTASYSRATNIVLVDLDVPGGTDKNKHLNKVLEAVGARKALLSGQRFVKPDFLFMSPTLNDIATNAEAFVYSAKRNGTDTNAEGDLERIKGLPAYGTNQPGIDLGDERILISPRNLLGYTISKPWSVEGAPFEVVNEDGLPLGKKQMYGEEYNAIHVPTPVRGYMTSVLCYSATGRAAA